MAYILNKASLLCRSALYKNIISGPIKNTRTKSYEHFTNKTNVWAEKKYKLKDHINDNYRLVYREELMINLTVAVAYHIGWIGLFSSSLTLGYLIYKKPPIEKEGMEGVSESNRVLRPLRAVERIVVLIVGCIMSIVLIGGSKTIPFRIYYNSTEKMYKAVFVNRIFGKKQMETFGDGTAVPVLNRKSLGDLLFNINGRIVLLDKECFPVPSVRDKMIRKTE